MQHVYLVVLFLFSLNLTGCATWEGIKEDTSDAAEWSKEKVNEGATYIKEKTD